MRSAHQGKVGIRGSVDPNQVKFRFQENVEPIEKLSSYPGANQQIGIGKTGVYIGPDRGRYDIIDVQSESEQTIGFDGIRTQR
jgi:hypothetical protein